jgi:hypothetical protein
MSAIETLPDGFVLYDADDRLVICNERYREIYAKSAPAIVEGARFEDILRYGLQHGQFADVDGREEDWLANGWPRIVPLKEASINNCATDAGSASSNGARRTAAWSACASTSPTSWRALRAPKGRAAPHRCDQRPAGGLLAL